MPILRSADSHPNPGAPDNPHYLAVHYVGSGPSGTLQASRGFTKKAPIGLTHLLVTIDKFTKWIEMMSLAKIASKQVVDFIQDIIFHFGVPNSIIIESDTHFTGEKSWISVMTITSAWTRLQSPTRVQTNRSSTPMA
jgi:hypothetical protein